MNDKTLHSARKTFLLLFLAYIGIFFIHAAIVGKTVYGDGIFYFSWLRTLVVDHDVSMTNDYGCFGITVTNQPEALDGKIGNKFSIGPALLWTPMYTSIRTIARDNGCGVPYQLAVGLTGTLAALTGLILLYRTLRRFYTERVSLLSVIGVAFATNLLYYGAIDPVNSHAVGFFAASVFLTALIGSDIPQSLPAGLALGFLGAIRPQDLIAGILILPILRRIDIPKFLAGFALMMAPQFIAWQALYGKFWISPYLTGSEGFDFLHPHLPGVLFSPSSGLFLWTPIVALSLAGLAMLSVRKPALGKPMLGISCIQLLIIASWSTWWQGASYSGRMFVASLPFVAFGLAEFFRFVTNRFFQGTFLVRMAVISFSVLNAVSILRFLLFTQ